LLARFKNLFRPEEGLAIEEVLAIDGAQEAKTPSPLQVYSGYRPGDEALISRHAIEQASVHSDHYVDGFGVKTLFACVPFLDPTTLNRALLQHPLPDDGFHAEAIEYVALLDAIERFAVAGSFTTMEAGAGWAPWLAMAGVVCRRLRVPFIHLIGIEASPERFRLMKRHLSFNHLVEDEGVAVTLFEGAVWSHDGVVLFPNTEVTDMGAAASDTAVTSDYRGRRSTTLEVPCTQLQSLVREQQSVDFLHVDVQGGESRLLASHRDWLNQSVKSMMIATHSRPLEGEIMVLLKENNWELLLEKPCRFRLGDIPEDWAGATTLDGSQYWLNLNLL